MKQSASIKRRIEIIKKMTDPLAALRELADLTYEIGEDACHEREEIRELTAQNRLALMGNGNPANSVIGRLITLEDKVSPLAKDICEIKNLFIGSLKSSEPSLKQRIDSFEKHVESSEKLLWAILSSIALYIVYQVLTTFL
jgi:hypothetical protein